jgi:hypothetical protein
MIALTDRLTTALADRARRCWAPSHGRSVLYRSVDGTTVTEVRSPRNRWR